MPSQALWIPREGLIGAVKRPDSIRPTLLRAVTTKMWPVSSSAISGP